MTKKTPNQKCLLNKEKKNEENGKCEQGCVHAGSNTTRATNKLNIYLLFTIDSTIVIRRFGEQFISLHDCVWWGTRRQTKNPSGIYKNKTEEEDWKSEKKKRQNKQTNSTERNGRSINCTTSYCYYANSTWKCAHCCTNFSVTTLFVWYTVAVVVCRCCCHRRLLCLCFG